MSAKQQQPNTEVPIAVAFQKVTRTQFNESSILQHKHIRQIILCHQEIWNDVEVCLDGIQLIVRCILWIWVWEKPLLQSPNVFKWVPNTFKVCPFNFPLCLSVSVSLYNYMHLGMKLIVLKRTQVPPYIFGSNLIMIPILHVIKRI